MDVTHLSAATLWTIVISALVVIGLVVWYAAARRRTRALRSHYDSEYNGSVARAIGRHGAEAELVNRQERVERFEIHPLTAQQRELFGQRWNDVQEMFVDNPGRAVTKADSLVAEVMQDRGYPVTDFEQRADALSVHHAVFVRNYRSARDVAERNRQGAATTEELRRALVYYRDLFEDLLQNDETVSDRPVQRAVESEVPLAGDRAPDDRVRRQPIAPPRPDRGEDAR